MIVRVLLVRHGESTWNAVGRWQGQQDPPLSETGEMQAKSAAMRLGGFDAIFASTLERAMTTATIISDAIGVGPVIALPDLIERCAGPWEGHTRPEIDELWPGFIEGGLRPDGFESEESLASRGLAAMDSIAETIGDGLALAVSHSGLIYSLERALDDFRGRLNNLGGVWLDRSENGNWTIGERVSLIDEETGAGVIE